MSGVGRDAVPALSPAEGGDFPSPPLVLSRPQRLHDAHLPFRRRGGGCLYSMS